jgi:hypothetical protein
LSPLSPPKLCSVPVALKPSVSSRWIQCAHPGRPTFSSVWKSRRPQLPDSGQAVLPAVRPGTRTKAREYRGGPRGQRPNSRFLTALHRERAACRRNAKTASYPSRTARRARYGGPGPVGPAAPGESGVLLRWSRPRCRTPDRSAARSPGTFAGPRRARKSSWLQRPASARGPAATPGRTDPVPQTGTRPDPASSPSRRRTVPGKGF